MTPQFGFVRLSDRFTTGSSIMPQKRNPDAAELVRAKVGRIAAAFQSLVLVMKGLPLAYAKDMQEDKEVAFDALASLRLAILAMTGMTEDLKPEAAAMLAAAAAGYSTATDLADWLVGNLNLPFREAHHITGRIVAAAKSSGVSLDKLPLEVMQEMHPGITERRLFRAVGAKFPAQPHELWGNGATECPQNGPKLDKAIGKAGGKGLETNCRGSGTAVLSGPFGAADLKRAAACRVGYTEAW